MPDSQDMDYNVKLKKMSEIAQFMYWQLVKDSCTYIDNGSVATNTLESLLGKPTKNIMKFLTSSLP